MPGVRRVTDRRRAAEGDSVLTEQQLAEILGVPLSVVVLWRAYHAGPPCVKLAGRTAYFQTDVAAWIDRGGARMVSIASPLPGAAGEGRIPVGVDSPREHRMAAGL